MNNFYPLKRKCLNLLRKSFIFVKEHGQTLNLNLKIKDNAELILTKYNYRKLRKKLMQFLHTLKTKINKKVNF